jgi:hypothetical protein
MCTSYLEILIERRARMTGRREFLQTATAALAFALQARELVHRGRIGEVRFCRVSHAGLLGLVPADCIAEVDAATDGITFLGTHATMVMNRSGCQLFTL